MNIKLKITGLVLLVTIGYQDNKIEY